ncbi:MAG: processed acidic surface protein, partial [Heyndrickxia sp.]
YMKDDYDVTIDDLKPLLKENGEVLNDYMVVDDLDMAVDFYFNPDGSNEDEEFDKDFINAMLPLLQDEFGLTKDELTNLKTHLEGLNGRLSTPEATERLDQLSQRMMTFKQFDSLDQLTSSQIQEFLSIYDELLSMMELKVKFSLVKGSKETTLSFLDLLKLESLNNAKLKASIYDLSGNLLADLIITGDMVDSGTIKHAGKDLNTATEKIKEVKKQQTKVKTVKGGQLPNTAGNYTLNILLGFIIAIAGIFGISYYRRAA